MSQKHIGGIGGSGLYQLSGLKDVREVKVSTPFGDPSDVIITGNLDGVPMSFIPRHGRAHTFTPSEVPYRANIYALKKVGVSHIISVSAVGSMREDVHPGDVVLVDQFFDRTKGRASTLFEGGCAAHVSFAEPVCPSLADDIHGVIKELGLPCHKGGTYICMEGPAFSTKAESQIYRKWGVDVIGMTNIPEAKLAREAELPFATMALVTDYDCWHDSHDAVTVEAVIATLKKNVANAQRIIAGAVPKIRMGAPSPAHNALAGAIMTQPDAIPPETRSRLSLLIDHRI